MKDEFTWKSIGNERLISIDQDGKIWFKNDEIKLAFEAGIKYQKQQHEK